ncbi:Tn3 family transposase [Nocardia sp. NPDC051787]|uniref:Tn3 family transposase n=1 Tax=Nocardia sp. NPDC051787 TaxID=3155415 RepID=UPI0034359517
MIVTRREAPYVLDEILGNAKDLPITEHATDTHGATLRFRLSTQHTRLGFGSRDTCVADR